MLLCNTGGDFPCRGIFIPLSNTSSRGYTRAPHPRHQGKRPHTSIESTAIPISFSSSRQCGHVEGRGHNLKDGRSERVYLSPEGAAYHLVVVGWRNPSCATTVGGMLPMKEPAESHIWIFLSASSRMLQPPMSTCRTLWSCSLILDHASEVPRPTDTLLQRRCAAIFRVISAETAILGQL